MVQTRQESKISDFFCSLTADEVFLAINLEISVTMEPKQRLIDHVTKLVTPKVLLCVCVCVSL